MDKRIYFTLFVKKKGLLELYLANIKVGDLQFVTNHKDLEALDLTKCQATNFEAIGSCEKLKRLFLEKETLDNTTFIEELINLESLLLHSSDIKQLPSFKNNINLKFVSLKSMSGIHNLEVLATAINLEALSISGSMTLDVQDLVFIEKCNRIKKVSIDIKDRKQGQRIYDYLSTIVPKY
jgi:hypothetical protein